ncbi:CRISPR-associated protein Cas4 [Dehalogenimonas sp. THU2]|uniref:CRISPR-associated protein Cas4 n=1 Tax=Dehalogenimonas sp. THU2 TaxID=3151121 RepID=UPI00321893D7
MFTEDDLLPISALQHLAFCERQAALIHLEGEWQENKLTVEGHGLHDKVHEDDAEVRNGVRLVRGLRVRSLEFGLVGAIDMLELTPVDSAEAGGVALPGLRGRFLPYIVEYKRGRPKLDHCDEIQLCAQALCLEEMLGASIAESAFFYGTPRRRHAVTLDMDLRAETGRLAVRLREIIDSGQTPPPEYAPRCQNCSLIDLCLPQAPRQEGSVSRYLKRTINEVTSEETA